MSEPKTSSSWLVDVHIYGGLILVAGGAAALGVPYGLIVLGVGLIAIGRWG